MTNDEQFLHSSDGSQPKGNVNVRAETYRKMEEGNLIRLLSLNA